MAEEGWIFTCEQLIAMSDDELKELIVVQPLIESYRETDRVYAESERAILLSTVEKNRRHTQYKVALEEFKSASISPDGSKAPLTQQIRELRKNKEFLYKQFKEENERCKMLTEECAEKRNVMIQVRHLYWASMEYRVQTILWQRASQRRGIIARQNRQIIRQQEEQRVEQQHQAWFHQTQLNLQEKVQHLKKEDLDAEMDDVCIICMEPHPIKETVLTCCGHRYGKECFQTWRNQCTINRCQVSCPMCKKQNNLSVTRFEERIIIDLC